MPAVDWDNSWTTTSLNGTSIANGSNNETGAISNDTKTETLISVEVQYGATANESAEVLIQHETDDTPNYEQEADQPTTLAMPVSPSTTHDRVFSIPADSAADFKVGISNDTGASITVTVEFKQATIQ